MTGCGCCDSLRLRNNVSLMPPTSPRTPGERRPRLTPADRRRAPARSRARRSPRRWPSADAARCSSRSRGGADSLALAAATAFEAPRAGLRAGAVIVDHGLQDGSARCRRARRATGARRSGSTRSWSCGSTVGADGGPEAAARAARYAALDAAADETGAAPCCSATPSTTRPRPCCSASPAAAGAASLQGMAAACGPLPRARCSASGARPPVQACADAGPRAVGRPAQRRPRLRARARARAGAARARGASSARASPRRSPAPPSSCAKTPRRFDEMIDEIIEEICEHAEAGISVSVGALAANPAALRQRIIRHVVASEFGVSLSRAQTLEVARLVTDWHGQGPIDLPGVSACARAGATCALATGRPRSCPRPLTRDADARVGSTASDRRHREQAWIRARSRTTSPRCSSPKSRSTRSSPSSPAQVEARLRGQGPAARRRAQGRRHGDGRPRPRAAARTSTMDWMAVSSYGAGTQSSGVVQILQGPRHRPHGRHVLIVEDIIDSGLTLQLAAREPRVARRGIRRGLRPAAQAGCRQGRGRRASTSASTSRTSSSSATASTTPSSYRNLRDVAILAPHVYAA